MIGISCWTIARRVEEFGLTHLKQFSWISDENNDIIVKDYMSRH